MADLPTAALAAAHQLTVALRRKPAAALTARARAFGLAPHKQDSWKLSKDPLFVEKVRDVVGLYLDPERAVVLCVAHEDPDPGAQPHRAGVPDATRHPGPGNSRLPPSQHLEPVRRAGLATGKVIGSLHARHLRASDSSSRCACSNPSCPSTSKKTVAVAQWCRRWGSKPSPAMRIRPGGCRDSALRQSSSALAVHPVTCERGLQEAEFSAAVDRCASGLGTQLAVESALMALDGVQRDEQTFTDLASRQSGG